MSNTNFIQLREKEASKLNDQNGVFSVVLEKPLKMENNDILSINSVFCDTRSPASGRIEITENNDDFNISFGYYLINGSNNGDFIYQDQTAPNVINNDKPDGKKYILSFGTNETGDLLELLEFALVGCAGVTDPVDVTFQVKQNIGSKLPTKYTLHAPGKQGGGFKVKFKMKNSASDDFLLKGILFKPSQPGVFHPDDFLPIGPTKGGQDVSDYLAEHYNIDTIYGPYITNAIPSIIGATMTPLINSFSFKIPQNSYTPDSLAKLITDKMINYKHDNSSPGNFIESSNNIQSVSNFATKNAFFTSIKQLQTDTDYNLAPPNVNFFSLISEDGETVLNIDRNCANNYVIGANQMALQFDPTLNKFLFTQIHSNMYDSTNNPIVKYIQKGAANDFFLMGAHSGVFFTAVNEDTHNLLFEELGFDSSLLTSHYIPTEEKTFGGVLVNSKVFTMDLKDGVNVTSNATIIDAAYQKNENFAILPQIGTPAAGYLEDIQTIEVNSIIGSNNQSSNQLTEGYFLVEISGIPQNNLVNSVNNQISCIVSKYQSTEDFTIITERAGAIQYQHKGIPLIISKLDVRILDPSGLPAINIGNNNTVFMELIKNSST